jgi:large subunit ribosomal protein L5
MRLKQIVNEKIIPDMSKDLKLSIMALPSLEKVTVNVGVGPYRDKKDSLEKIKEEIKVVFAQAPTPTTSKKSISGFKLRQGQQVGFKLTLRNERMWDFVERFIAVCVPRLRDFEGFSKKFFDTAGNFTIGLVDQTIFPEIKPEEITDLWGMSITFKLKNAENEEIRSRFLKEIGFIFK